MMMAVFIFMLIIAANPAIPMKGARESVELCLFAVIPSLFPFFVLNGILLRSGAIAGFCSRFLKPFPKIFNLPPSAAAAVILGFISGYPAGIKAAGELYENGSLTEAQYERLIAFCGNAGPAFITGTVGVGMFNSLHIGLMLFAVHLITAVIAGLIFRFYKPGAACAVPKAAAAVKKPFALLFTEAVSDSVKSISSVCGYVIFFGMVTAFIDNYTSFLPGLFKGILTGFIEMTNGCSALSKTSAPLRLKTAAVSAAIGWGGLCVHAQSLEFLKSAKTYLAGKALQSLLSFILTYLIFSGKGNFYSVSTTAAAAATVIITAVILTAFISAARRQSRRF